MKKQKRVMRKCKYCGGLFELYEHYTSYSEEGVSIPVVYAPTIEDAKKMYKEITGDDYEDLTGDSFEENFYKAKKSLSHLSIDDSFEEMDKHTLGEIECWNEEI